MLTKLFWRSFLKQYKDYTVYFICMTFAVMIYYSFAAMTRDQPLVQRAQPEIQISSVLSLGNLAMLLILIFFMLSANRFFVVKRYREMSLYQLFGLRKRRIMSQFVLENFAMNVAAFVTGILMGIIFSKLFAMILVKAMDLDLTSHFYLSLSSVYGTLLAFLLIYGGIACQNAWLIRRNQLQDLFGQRSQKILRKMRGSRWTGLLGVLGLACLLVGYWLSFFIREYIIAYISATNRYGIILWLPFLVLTLCVVGTYLFFRFTLPTFFRFLRRFRKHAYQHLRFYAYGNSPFQILSHWRSLAWATLATAAALTVIAGALSFVTIRSQVSRNSNPSDFQVRGEDTDKLASQLAQLGGKVTHTTTLHYKVTMAHTTRLFLRTDKSQQVQLYDLLTEEEYRAFAKQHPDLPAVQLKNDHEAVMFEYGYTTFRNTTTVDHRFTLPNLPTLEVKQFYPDLLGDTEMRYGMGVLVVTQKTYNQATGVVYPIAMVEAKLPAEKGWSLALNDTLPTSWGDEIYYQYSYANQKLSGQLSTDQNQLKGTSQSGQQSYNRLNLINRYQELRRLRRESGIFVYVAVFIGMTISVTTAGIMMLRLFSQLANETQNFQLLRKLGISRKAIRGIIHRQLAWVFAPPILLIVCHSSFAIHVWAQFIHSESYWLAYLFCVVMALMYVLAYGISSHFFIRAAESD